MDRDASNVLSMFGDRIDGRLPMSNPWLGQSFRINDLALIRKEATSGDGYRCVLVTKHGTEYDLTYWYGNPVDKIVGEIRACLTIQRLGLVAKRDHRIAEPRGERERRFGPRKWRVAPSPPRYPCR